MITAIVQFDLPSDVDRQKAAETFQRIAPLYRDMDGLIHKYFCFSDEGKGAGIYLWETREAAERFMPEYGVTELRNSMASIPKSSFMNLS